MPMPMPMPNPGARRAVFFDFAGTLFSDRALRDVHLRQLRFVADTVGVEPADSELRTAYRQGMGVAYRAIAGRSSYSHRELFGAAFAAMAQAMGGALSEAQVDAAVDRQYAATIEHATLRPDCVPTLQTLRKAGFHVQVVSNIDDEQLEPMLDRLGLMALLDAWTSSQQAGSCKPDPGIYRVALEKAGCEPPAVLFVGDSPVHDVQGPAQAGMRTALLVADAKSGSAAARAASADHVIEQLGEVPVLVGAR